jgi:hypothetical protein
MRIKVLDWSMLTPPSPSIGFCGLEAITEPKLPEMHHRALLGHSTKGGYYQKLSITELFGPSEMKEKNLT